MYRAISLRRAPANINSPIHSKPINVNDRRGRFNLDEAAAALQMNESYASALYKPLHYTFNIRGQHYPAEQGRSSRPGAIAASRNKMFPLFCRNSKLDAELFRIHRRDITTE